MRSPPPIWDCCAHRARRVRSNWNSAPSSGGRGGPMPPCICGRRRRLQMTNYTYMESPVGRLLLAGDEAGLQLVAFTEGKRAIRPEPDWRDDAEPLRRAVEQLQAYFAGDLRKFDLPL